MSDILNNMIAEAYVIGYRDPIQTNGKLWGLYEKTASYYSYELQPIDIGMSKCGYGATLYKYEDLTSAVTELKEIQDIIDMSPNTLNERSTETQRLKLTARLSDSEEQMSQNKEQIFTHKRLISQHLKIYKVGMTFSELNPQAA